MVQASSRIDQTRSDVFGFKVRVIGKDFLPTLARCQEPEHIGDAYAHGADAWAATALVGIDRDSRQKVCHRGLSLHTSKITLSRTEAFAVPRMLESKDEHPKISSVERIQRSWSASLLANAGAHPPRPEREAAGLPRAAAWPRSGGAPLFDLAFRRSRISTT
jgi:hypothetical protein